MAERDGGSGIVGRDRERARLEAGFEAAAQGRGSTIIVGGEAGIGKTTLVAHLAATARAAGATVLTGACLPTGSASIPYAPLVEALRTLTRAVDPARAAALLGPARHEIARLLPEVSPGLATAPDRLEFDRAGQSRLFEAVLGVIERHARVGPVVLMAEDIQWADDGTRGLLGFLSRTLRGTPVLLLLTLRIGELDRRDPAQAFVAELERQAWVERFDLDALTRRDVAVLLRNLVGRPLAAEAVDDVMARSGGNPFFVEQLASTVTDGADGRALPPGLRDVLTGRLAGLPDATQRLLRAASAAARWVDDDLLAAVLDIPPRVVADALRPALVQRILIDADWTRDGHGGYAFRHALVAEVAYADLLHGERARLHAAFGRELERRGEIGGVPVTPAELAHHWVAARDGARAAPALVAAGAAAESVYAFAEARRHYELALELWQPDSRPPVTHDRVAVLQRAAECAVLSGAYRRAIELGQAAITTEQIAEAADGRPDDGRLGALHDRLRWYLWEAGDRVAAEAAVNEALRLIPDEPPSAARARALAQSAGLRLFAGDPTQAESLATDAIGTARAAGSSSEEALGLGVLGWARAVTGDVESGLATYQEGLAIAERLGGVEGIALGHANLAALLDRVGRTEASLAAAREGYAIAQHLGVARTYGGGLMGHVAKALFDLGRWGEAATAADEGLDLDPVGRSAIMLHLYRARVDTNQGRFEAAHEHLRQAAGIDAARSGAIPSRAALLAATAELATVQGDLLAVRAVVDEALGSLDADLPIDPALGWLGWHALRAEADAADGTRARHDEASVGEIGRRVAPLAQRLLGSGRGVATTDRRLAALGGLCHGELGRVSGRSDAATWARAAADWDGLSRPAPAAYARYRAAEAGLGASGDRLVVATALRAAHVASIRLGAGPLVRDIERLARHARIDLIVGGSGADRPVDPLGLTEREAEVIRLVAEGRSNQQIADALFITRKTASVHVSNILGKLGVANRVEAAAVAQRLGLHEDRERN